MCNGTGSSRLDIDSKQSSWCIRLRWRLDRDNVLRLPADSFNYVPSFEWFSLSYYYRKFPFRFPFVVVVAFNTLRRATGNFKWSVRDSTSSSIDCHHKRNETDEPFIYFLKITIDTERSPSYPSSRRPYSSVFFKPIIFCGLFLLLLLLLLNNIWPETIKTQCNNILKSERKKEKIFGLIPPAVERTFFFFFFLLATSQDSQQRKDTKKKKNLWRTRKNSIMVYNI